MESELNCGVCGNEYTASNLPRLLTTCGHTYCERCLDTMITEEDFRHKVTCPEDNVATYLEGSDLAQLPRNIALIKVIETKNARVSPFKDGSLDLTKIHLREEHDLADCSEQDILSQIDTHKRGSLSVEETSSKEEGGPQGRQSEKKSQEGQWQEGRQQDRQQRGRSQEGWSQGGRKEERRAEYEMCLPHQKPMDVVCLEDMVRICAKCAIFGEHKGHEFKSIENVEEEWDGFREHIMNVYKRKEALEKLIADETTAKYLLGLFDQHKRKLLKELTERFKRLKELVKRLEEAATRQLEELTVRKEQQVKSLFLLSSVVAGEYQEWEDRSFGLIIQTEECSLEEKLKNLYDYNTTRMLTQGESILEKIKHHEQNIPNAFEDILKTVSLQCDESALPALERYLTVIEVKESAGKGELASINKARSQMSFEESLLQSDLGELKEHKELFINIHGYESPKIEEFLKPENGQSTSKIFREMSVFLSQQQPEVLLLGKLERPPKKKLKLIKAPQKIEKTLEQLYSDSLDLLDLTNAQLGDATILQICEFLRGSKVRVVKFIRNKLTDEAMPKMLYALGNIITLYLSQNLLTEQSIEHLIAGRSCLPNLKSVILSQNKIIERKHKAAIERLRKLDIVVSV